MMSFVDIHAWPWLGVIIFNILNDLAFMTNQGCLDFFYAKLSATRHTGLGLWNLWPCEICNAYIIMTWSSKEYMTQE